ncbi:MAG: hypothetical protein JNK99_10655 [Candidatus Accumulibacter sp.]|jgi:hypothetical protein|uniref:hypothetical protein n=1 Tax=Accumulibacter sp. TaxID=2053492 RepID=UPI001A6106FA|nr:hypothetical protein [Accumulibacter sp.]MBL8395188.1 hypothetical protein [Accumulibacter sp.]
MQYPYGAYQEIRRIPLPVYVDALLVFAAESAVKSIASRAFSQAGEMRGQQCSCVQVVPPDKQYLGDASGKVFQFSKIWPIRRNSIRHVRGKLPPHSSGRDKLPHSNIRLIGAARASSGTASAADPQQPVLAEWRAEKSCSPTKESKPTTMEQIIEDA